VQSIVKQFLCLVVFENISLQWGLFASLAILYHISISRMC